MKKLLFLGVGSALMFTMGGVGSAQADTLGPIHASTSIATGAGAQLVSPGAGRCASCHRAHTAKAAMLLKDSQPALCYSCHGGGAGTFLDVVDGIDNSMPASTNALRGGGFAYAKLDGAGATLKVGPEVDANGRTVKTGTITPLATGTAVTSRHQIDGVTTGTMWGNGVISSSVNLGKPGVTLECGSCHDPHGNGNYRLLKPVPNDASPVSILVKAEVPEVPASAPGVTPVVTYKAAVPAVMSPGTEGVNIPDAIGTRVYTTTNYWKVTDRNVPTVKPAAGVTPVAPIAGATDGYITNVSQWCSTCHTRYLAQSPAYETDSTDAVFTYRHTSNRIDKDGVGRPNCIQCHVSHGTNVAMTGDAAAFTAPDGKVPGAKGTAGVGAIPKTGADVAITGTSRLLRVDNRGTCQMCHNK